MSRCDTTGPACDPAGRDVRKNDDFRKQIDGYGLTTAEILYRMPDHPRLLQAFLWQEYDRAPDFPVLRGFLEWWRREIEGMLHSVRVGHKALIGPADFRPVRAEFRLN